MQITPLVFSTESLVFFWIFYFLTKVRAAAFEPLKNKALFRCLDLVM